MIKHNQGAALLRRIARGIGDVYGGDNEGTRRDLLRVARMRSPREHAGEVWRWAVLDLRSGVGWIGEGVGWVRDALALALAAGVCAVTEDAPRYEPAAPDPLDLVRSIEMAVTTGDQES